MQNEEKQEEVLEETAEDRERGSLIHKLGAAASKFDLHEGPVIRKAITDQVAILKKQYENDKLQLNARLGILKKTAKKARKDAVQAINEEYNAAMSNVAVQEAEGLDELQKAFRAGTDTLEDELNVRIAYINTLVKAFKLDLEKLSLVQLQLLDSEGVVEVENGEWMHAPGKES